MDISVVSAAVEGNLDEVVLRKIADHIGFSIGSVYGLKGKPHLLKSLPGYNKAAQFAPWIVMLDLDRDYECAPEALRGWLPKPAENMLCRVAVHAIEAWLLADRDRIAAMLGISVQRIPKDPDSLDDPKRHLVELARNSSRGEIRASIVPRPGSGRSVGPNYHAKMVDFVTAGRWRINTARYSSASLQRTLDRLQEVALKNSTRLSPLGSTAQS
jgi:hypothetical protein